MLPEQEVHSDEVISVPGQVLYPQLVEVQESQWLFNEPYV